MRGCLQLSNYILFYVYMVINNVTSLRFEFNIVVIIIDASPQYCSLLVSVFRYHDSMLTGSVDLLDSLYIYVL
jgi:hypothetical protein